MNENKNRYRLNGRRVSRRDFIKTGATGAAVLGFPAIVRSASDRKIVIVNSHGGNLDLISILARELRVQAGMLAVKCQWGNFGARPNPPC